MNEDIKELTDELQRLNYLLEDTHEKALKLITSVALRYKLNLVLEKVPKKVHKN